MQIHKIMLTYKAKMGTITINLKTKRGSGMSTAQNKKRIASSN